MKDKAFFAKIAKAARSLSEDCVNGTAPPFGTGRPWIFINNKPAPFCALGHVFHRAGFGPDDDVDDEVNNNTGYEQRSVWLANDNAPEGDRHGAVVFPLLAFADALEAA